MVWKGRYRKLEKGDRQRRDGAVRPGKHNKLHPLCSDLLSNTQGLNSLELCLYNYTVIMGSISPIPRLSMVGWSTTESALFDEEPKTPSRRADSSASRVDTEIDRASGTCRESRLSTLRVDAGVTESLQSGARRVSPSGSSSDSPASSASAHSRQDSTASYTPLRSARGSLSLGVSFYSKTED